MKNIKKGPLLVVLIVLIAIGGIYFYTNKDTTSIKNKDMVGTWYSADNDSRGVKMVLLEDRTFTLEGKLYTGEFGLEDKPREVTEYSASGSWNIENTETGYYLSLSLSEPVPDPYITGIADTKLLLSTQDYENGEITFRLDVLMRKGQ